MERHAQYINRGELAKAAWIAARELTGHRSAGGEQLHCASLGFFLPPPPFFVAFLFITIIIIIIFHYYYC